MITPYMKFNQNLRGRVLFQDFFGRSVVERPSYYYTIAIEKKTDEKVMIGPHKTFNALKVENNDFIF